MLCQWIRILPLRWMHPSALGILYSTHEDTCWIPTSYCTMHMAHDVPLMHPSAFKQWKEEWILNNTSFDTLYYAHVLSFLMKNMSSCQYKIAVHICFDTYTNIIITNVVPLDITLATIIHVCVRQCVISCLITIFLVLLCQWIRILPLRWMHPSALGILYSTHEELAEYLTSTSFVLCTCSFLNASICIHSNEKKNEYWILYKLCTLYYAHVLSFLMKTHVFMPVQDISA